MKKFTLEADLILEADDLDDAFVRLIEHFQRLRVGESGAILSGEEKSIILSGFLKLEPEDAL